MRACILVVVAALAACTAASRAQPAAPEAVGTTAAPDVSALINQLSSPASRKTARAALIAIGRDATPVMLTRMRDPSFTIRWEMANIQGDIRDERALPGLVDNVVRDVDPHVRWRSIWAINEYPDRKPAIELLRQELASEDEGVRWNAAVGLSTMNVTEVLPAIHAGISHADGWRRWEAINALARIHDATSAAALEPVLLSGKPRDRNEAVMSLGRMSGEKAGALLIQALGDASADVRWRAAMGLASMRHAAAVEPLKALKATEKDALVVEHVDKALKALGAAEP